MTRGVLKVEDGRSGGDLSTSHPTVTLPHVSLLRHPWANLLVCVARNFNLVTYPHFLAVGHIRLGSHSKSKTGGIEVI